MTQNDTVQRPVKHSHGQQLGPIVSSVWVTSLIPPLKSSVGSFLLEENQQNIIQNIPRSRRGGKNIQKEIQKVVQAPLQYEPNPQTDYVSQVAAIINQIPYQSNVKYLLSVEVQEWLFKHLIGVCGVYKNANNEITSNFIFETQVKSLQLLLQLTQNRTVLAPIPQTVNQEHQSSSQVLAYDVLEDKNCLGVLDIFMRLDYYHIIKETGKLNYGFGRVRLLGQMVDSVRKALLKDKSLANKTAMSCALLLIWIFKMFDDDIVQRTRAFELSDALLSQCTPTSATHALLDSDVASAITDWRAKHGLKDQLGETKLNIPENASVGAKVASRQLVCAQVIAQCSLLKLFKIDEPCSNGQASKSKSNLTSMLSSVVGCLLTLINQAPIGAEGGSDGWHEPSQEGEADFITQLISGRCGEAVAHYEHSDADVARLPHEGVAKPNRRNRSSIGRTKSDTLSSDNKTLLSQAIAGDHVIIVKQLAQIAGQLLSNFTQALTVLNTVGYYTTDMQAVDLHITQLDQLIEQHQHAARGGHEQYTTGKSRDVTDTNKASSQQPCTQPLSQTMGSEHDTCPNTTPTSANRRNKNRSCTTKTSLPDQLPASYPYYAPLRASTTINVRAALHLVLTNALAGKSTSAPGSSIPLPAKISSPAAMQLLVDHGHRPRDALELMLVLLARSVASDNRKIGGSNNHEQLSSDLKELLRVLGDVRDLVDGGLLGGGHVLASLDTVSLTQLLEYVAQDHVYAHVLVTMFGNNLSEDNKMTWFGTWLATCVRLMNQTRQLCSTQFLCTAQHVQRTRSAQLTVAPKQGGSQCKGVLSEPQQQQGSKHAVTQQSYDVRTGSLTQLQQHVTSAEETTQKLQQTYDSFNKVLQEMKVDWEQLGDGLEKVCLMGELSVSGRQLRSWLLRAQEVCDAAKSELEEASNVRG